METAMTPATISKREQAQQIKFRACLAHAVRYKTRNKVKDQIKAAGNKVSNCSARELSQMAEEYLAQPGHQEILIQSVLPWVHELVFKPKPTRR